jgi:hypothetical protein
MKFAKNGLLSIVLSGLVSLSAGFCQSAPLAAAAGAEFSAGGGRRVGAISAGGLYAPGQGAASDSLVKDDAAGDATAATARFRQGLRGLMELGYFGIGGGNYDELKLGLSLGYQFNQFFLAGIGAGARKNLENSGALTYPFFTFLRVSSVEQKVTPYFMMGMGNFFKREEALEEGGLFLSSTLGAKLNLSKRTAMYLGLGIEIQNERWTSNNSAGLNLGLIF